jgi:ABC-type bacteriocin/lantibiotic exporter with double-glycine peptidase domain
VKRQSKSYWCGVASIANALEVLGIRRSQREIARLCDVSPEAGCNETELKRALLANGVQVDEWKAIKDHEADDDASEDWLWSHIANRGPAILCVDDDDHWVTVIGTCGFNYIVFDPSRNQGIEVHTPESLADRWMSSDFEYYGIGVSL